MRFETVKTALHVALLDEATGQGVVICPPAVEDVQDPWSVESLQQADWDSMARVLASKGYTLRYTDDWEEVSLMRTRDGREVLSLVAFNEPWCSEMSHVLARLDMLEAVAHGACA